MSAGAAWGEGSVGIVDEVGSRRTDLIRHARLDFSYGSTRTQLWLWRVHRLRVSQTTIQRVVQELGLPRVKPVRKRRPRSAEALRAGAARGLRPYARCSMVEPPV